MRLHQHFIINFLIVFAATLFLSAVVSYFTIKQINIGQYQNSLKAKIELIKIELGDIKDLSKFATLLKQKTGHRLTIISDSGVVLNESDYDVAKMENHKNREEIKIARVHGDGYAIRHSKTLDKDFLYMASKAELKGKPIFIRLSLALTSITNEFYKMWIGIIIIFSFSILFILYVMYRLSHKIREEIVKVTSTLDQISNKNYKAVVNASFSKEFYEIESHIKKLSNVLEKRAKQKRKYTAKIRLISKQRSDIISAISHEFKNPIASVIGYAQTLVNDPNTNINIRKRFLEKIITNSEKISSMIDRLSLATKFENGDFAPSLVDFDLWALTNDIVNNFRDKNPNRVFKLIGEPYPVNADKTMIEMVIINLVDNSLKYSEDDIFIEIHDGSLHVKDKGIGIAPEELEKVTHKFYRSNIMSWDNSMGLGLALVKYILNLHDSTLLIKSELGLGSDFSFKL
jgi:signal transduction histidine kinase